MHGLHRTRTAYDERLFHKKQFKYTDDMLADTYCIGNSRTYSYS